jgi:hypothetical protein
MKNAVFWDVAPCRSCVNRRFGWTFRLHLHGRKIREWGTSLSRWLQTESAANRKSVYKSRADTYTWQYLIWFSKYVSILGELLFCAREWREYILLPASIRPTVLHDTLKRYFNIPISYSSYSNGGRNLGQFSGKLGYICANGTQIFQAEQSVMYCVLCTLWYYLCYI